MNRLAEWLKSWDIAAWVAAVLCALPSAIILFAGHPIYEVVPVPPAVPLWETLFSVLLMITSSVVLFPILAATPWVTFLLVRRTRLRVVQLPLLAISAATNLLYYRFVETADLTSTSTAPLAAMFYPGVLACVAVPLSLAISYFGKRLGPESG